MVTASDEDLELLSSRLSLDPSSPFGDRPNGLYTLKLLRFLETRGPLGAPGGGPSVTFGVSLQHIYAYSPALYFAITNAPQDATAAFDAILRAKFAELREMHGLYQMETSDRNAADELLLQQVID